MGPKCTRPENWLAAAFVVYYIALRNILCLAYNELDQPGITNVTKRINEIKVVKTQDKIVSFKVLLE